MTPAQVKRLRLSLGETQAEFARRLGNTEITVRCWEAGRRNPSGTAKKLLQIVKNEIGNGKTANWKDCKKEIERIFFGEKKGESGE